MLQFYTLRAAETWNCRNSVGLQLDQAKTEKIVPDSAFHNLSVDVYGGYAADSAINFFCVCVQKMPSKVYRIHVTLRPF